MPFVVFVASDMFGQKLNLELEFPFSPSIQELTSYIERAFTAEMQSRRSGAAPYQVAKLHVVDEVSDDWVECTAPHQLRNYCQVYAFQPHSTRYTETQGHIPPAVKPRLAQAAPAGITNYSSAPRATQPTASPRPGVSSSLSRPPPHHDAPRVLPEDVQHDEKVRILFEELDTNRNRMLEMDEMRRGFRVTGLDFTAGTTDDLFKKADADRDGVVSFPEWQRFCELYPTLTDSLYFRLKAHYEHAAQEQACLDCRNGRPQLEEHERRAKAQYDQSQLDADDASRRLADSDRAVTEAAARGRAAEEAVREGARVVDRARQGRAERERDLAAEREKERQAQLRAQDSTRELEATQRQMSNVQQALSDAEAMEQRVLQELADVQREVARQRQAVELASADVARAQDRHNQVMLELPRGVEDAAGLLAQADQEVQQAERNHRELSARAQDLNGVAAEVAHSRDDAARLMQQLRDAQEPARQVWLEAQRELEEHDRRVTEMEAMLAADADKRRSQDDQEKALVEQEIRLREQRETLEQREASLREAHSSFFKPGSSPSRAAAGGPQGTVVSRTFTSHSQTHQHAASYTSRSAY